MKEIIETAKDLISYPSVSRDRETLHSVCDYIEQFFDSVPGLYIHRFENGGYPSLLVSNTQTHYLKPSVGLFGHIDVVDAQDFTATETEGRLYGRGAADMKSEVAVLLHIMKNLVNTPVNLSLIISTDEEIGGANSSAYLAHTVGFRPQVLILPDGGDAPNQIVVANKGVLHIQVTSTGTSGHSSRPHLAHNPIDQLFAKVQTLKERLGEDLSVADGWSNTATLTCIVAGESVNQIPETATGKIDIRFTETHSLAEVRLIVAEVFTDDEWCELAAGNKIYTAVENTFLKEYTALLAREFGISEIDFRKSAGSNDGRFFSHIGIPVIVSRPVSGGQHTDSEWVDIQSLGQFYEINKAFIESLS